MLVSLSFSNDGKLILCGSEDKFVHIWRTNHDVPNTRKDRNEYYESFSGKWVLSFNKPHGANRYLLFFYQLKKAIQYLRANIPFFMFSTSKALILVDQNIWQ